MPEWAAPYLVRRVLWANYGIAYTDAGLEDVFAILQLEKAIRDREAYNRRQR